MTRNNTTGAKHVVAGASGRSILPLPDEVVAQIKSSTAIVSLTGVVLELLKNCLDAKATRIEATVDVARGGCIVEDDGLGISPLEFHEEGGLGKLYCTSKFHSDEPLLGRNGTFLASLAAMSLLTIASHHHEYRSHNSITLHHSKTIERQLPASAGHEVPGKHGTRVTVRNLFGNMPVRVKQRSLAAGQKAEKEKLWDAMRRDIAGLLLSWQGRLSLRVRDDNNRVLFSFNTSASSVTRSSKEAVKPRPSQLTSLLSVLTQANYITVDEWPSWVPASASTSTISVKGAISLDPAPSRQVQFISLGLRPLSPDCGHNELFDQVNRLFALSSFGTLEHVVDEQEKVRRQSDKRFKHDGYTNRQLKARKDVDRYPMFHLRISLREARASVSEDQFLGDEANLQNVMKVIDAMITQWLSVHHFRPPQSRKKDDRPNTASTLLSDAGESDTLPASLRNASASQRVASKNGSASAMPRKRKRSNGPDSHVPYERHRGAFAEWSRIKSGKSDFFNNIPARPKSTSQTKSADDPDVAVRHAARTAGVASFNPEPIAQGTLSALSRDELLQVTQTSNAGDKENDDTILWTDPTTRKTHALNTRPGCAIPETQPRPSTDSPAPTFGVARRPRVGSVRLSTRASPAVIGKTPWLDDVLRDWENPIFKPSEKRIQQIGIDEDRSSQGKHHSHHGCSHNNIDKAFNASTTASSSRFSKESLQTAQVIGQIDKKFILVKMQNSPSASDTQPDMLVLIDQHAADERVQVESLFSQLCAPAPHDVAHAQSDLGHASRIKTLILDKPLAFAVSAQESALFSTHAARFAAWGILYNMTKDGKQHAHLSVTALPPPISQRCTLDPATLISLLRSTVWSWSQLRHLPPLPPLPLHSSSSSSISHLNSTPQSQSQSHSPSWPLALSTCPPALVDLINSRACRSAIMFNDELSRPDCVQLVRNLAHCVFPFFCAHGRPSMVPVLGLGGSLGGEHDGGGGGGGGEEEGFVRAWKRWRGK
ncbi:dna mismatch repair protein [Stemphylium lycopersici]|nr:dna mismatch repair protein [Stemphylium lycopersici]